MKTNDHQAELTRKQERMLLKLAVETSRTGHPNESREGCPGRATLNAVVNQSLAADKLGEAVDHIANCSPCFAEYERIRFFFRARRAVSLAAAMGTIGMLLFVGIHTRAPKPAPANPTPQLAKRSQEPAPVAVTMDLRRGGPVRGADTTRPASPIGRLIRGRLQLQIQLPLGSQEGKYEVALFAGPRLLLAGSGEALFQDQAEVLTLSLDTTSIPPGNYSLRLRPVGGAWLAFPVLVE